jgi:hypothetical protein
MRRLLVPCIRYTVRNAGTGTGEINNPNFQKVEAITKDTTPDPGTFRFDCSVLISMRSGVEKQTDGSTFIQQKSHPLGWDGGYYHYTDARLSAPFCLVATGGWLALVGFLPLPSAGAGTGAGAAGAATAGLATRPLGRRTISSVLRTLKLFAPRYSSTPSP